MCALCSVRTMTRASMAESHQGTHRCESCGYDLAGLGTAVRCPECGEQHTPRPPTRRLVPLQVSGLASLAIVFGSLYAMSISGEWALIAAFGPVLALALWQSRR